MRFPESRSLMSHILGIRREDKDQWERRAPLIPQHVKELREKHDIETIVQTSQIRDFSEKHYYIELASNTSKESIIEVDGRTLHANESFSSSTQLFHIIERDISDDANKISELRVKSVLKEVHLLKETYEWPGRQVQCAFVHVDGLNSVCFFEIESSEKWNILEVKRYLVPLGYANVVSSGYDTITKGNASSKRIKVIISITCLIILILSIVWFTMMQ